TDTQAGRRTPLLRPLRRPSTPPPSTEPPHAWQLTSSTFIRRLDDRSQRLRTHVFGRCHRHLRRSTARLLRPLRRPGTPPPSNGRPREWRLTSGTIHASARQREPPAASPRGRSPPRPPGGGWSEFLPLGAAAAAATLRLCFGLGEVGLHSARGLAERRGSACGPPPAGWSADELAA